MWVIAVYPRPEIASMSRIGLAFSSFFRLLFGKKLSPAVADYLPPEVARLSAGDAPPPKAAKPEPKPSAPAPRRRLPF